MFIEKKFQETKSKEWHKRREKKREREKKTENLYLCMYNE